MLCPGVPRRDGLAACRLQAGQGISRLGCACGSSQPKLRASALDRRKAEPAGA